MVVEVTTMLLEAVAVVEVTTMVMAATAEDEPVR